jgi:hypothetical protein
MPPQQPNGLLEFVDKCLDFSAHANLSVAGLWIVIDE